MIVTYKLSHYHRTTQHNTIKAISQYQEQHATCGDFALKPLKHVRCVMQGVNWLGATDDKDVGTIPLAKINTNNAGILFRDPYSTFSGSAIVQLMWATKWNTTGLMPLRPLLICRQDFTVPSGKAMMISS